MTISSTENGAESRWPRLQFVVTRILFSESLLCETGAASVSVSKPHVRRRRAVVLEADPLGDLLTHQGPGRDAARPRDPGGSVENLVRYSQREHRHRFGLTSCIDRTPSGSSLRSKRPAAAPRPA